MDAARIDPSQGTAWFDAAAPGYNQGATILQRRQNPDQWEAAGGRLRPPDATPLERLTYLIMPAIALGIPNSALIIRFTRTSMLVVLQKDYVRTARAKSA